MLSGIVFDLDGTLWHTEKVYVYAYRKLCEKYNVSEPLSDSMIEACLGVKIDKVLTSLFPSVENLQELTSSALSFAVEYVLAHPDDCCFDGVAELLHRLSEEYPVYIVSNCLRAFADAFVCISGTADAVKGIYTIEEGEKSEHLEKIADSLGGKMLFVGDCDDDYEAIKDHYTQYFCYAEYGYKPCGQYDYSIKTPLELLDIIKKINIKERQLCAKKYRMISHGKNQVTLIRNPDGTEYFGFVEYADDNFDLVVKQLKSLSTGRLIGPINSNTYYPYRFAVDGYDWRLYPDCEGKKELPVFLSNGFHIHQEYVSLLTGINHGMWRRAKKAALPDGYRAAIFSGAEVYERLTEVYKVAVEAFSDGYLYEPISQRDFIDIYVEGLKGITPDLVMLYHFDKPIAFCFCYEDPQKRFYVCKTIAVKKEERNMGVVMRLTDLSYQMMTDKGYSEVLHHFKNLKEKKSFVGFDKFLIRQKRYALLEWTNDK